MKIAVTSCSDPFAHPQQEVWTRVAQAAPDHLILLGDQIYMDYGPKIVSLFWSNPANGEPAEFSDVAFAAHMYARYAAQWRCMQASGLWTLPALKVHGIWDDHDFAWNNSFGAGDDNPNALKKFRPVPPNKQQVARALFRQFFGNLRAPVYPANTLLTQAHIDALNEDLSQAVYFTDMPNTGSGFGCVTLDERVKLLLTDGRTFRTMQHAQAAKGTVCGAAQMDWIKQCITDNAKTPGAITVIASGSTLGSGPERWEKYKDHGELLGFLRQQSNPRVLMLSGDMHRTEVVDQYAPHLIEIIASGAARPFGNWAPWRASRGNFALCEISASAVQVTLHEGESKRWIGSTRVVEIDRDTWRVRR